MLQEKLEAAQAMQRAIVVANNSTAGIADVAANFETLQVCDTMPRPKSMRLASTVRTMQCMVALLMLPTTPP